MRALLGFIGGLVAFALMLAPAADAQTGPWSVGGSIGVPNDAQSTLQDFQSSPWTTVNAGTPLPTAVKTSWAKLLDDNFTTPGCPELGPFTFAANTNSALKFWTDSGLVQAAGSNAEMVFQPVSGGTVNPFSCGSTGLVITMGYNAALNNGTTQSGWYSGGWHTWDYVGSGTAIQYGVMEWKYILPTIPVSSSAFCPWIQWWAISRLVTSPIPHQMSEHDAESGNNTPATCTTELLYTAHRWPATAPAGTVSGSGNTATTFGSTVTGYNSNPIVGANPFAGRTVLFTSGADAGDTATIASTTNAGQITLTAPLPSTPATGDAFSVPVPAGEVNGNEHQSILIPAPLFDGALHTMDMLFSHDREVMYQDGLEVAERAVKGDDMRQAKAMAWWPAVDFTITAPTTTTYQTTLQEATIYQAPAGSCYAIGGC